MRKAQYGYGSKKHVMIMCDQKQNGNSTNGYHRQEDECRVVTNVSVYIMSRDFIYGLT